MRDYRVTYGGRQGRDHPLSVSDEFVVVRTRRRSPLNATKISTQSRRQLDAMSTIVTYAEAGVEVLRHPGRRAEALAGRNRVRTALKKEPEIEFAGRVLRDKKSGGPVVYTENFFVKFNDDLKTTACRRLLRKHGLKIKRELPYAHNAYFAAAPEGTGLKVFSQAGLLLKEKDVELCHPELIRPASRRGAFPEQWHLQRTQVNGHTIDQHANVVAAWQVSQGEGITVAVIDDGFDLGHEEFAGSWKVVFPRDVTRGNTDPSPGNFDDHGTACAGVACANGVSHASGVAPKAKLMPIRLASALGSQAEAEAFVWAADHGADVISCSWGPMDGDWWDPNDPTHDQVAPLPDSTRLAIDYAIAQGRNGKGCIITWAAGNGNESVDNDGYAANPKVMAVAACNDKGKRSAYSDRGDALWCCFPSSHGFPSLTPGIWTTDRSGSVGYTPGNYTDDFGGTSSAAPGVAGVAALVLSRNVDLRWDQVMDVIMNSCDGIDTAGGGYDANGHSKLYGFGRVNAGVAVELATPEPVSSYRAIHTAVQDIPIDDLKISKLAVAVGDSKPIQEIEVAVDIEHTYVGDLIVRLVPPADTGLAPITLHDREGGPQDNIKRSYDIASTPEFQDLIGVVPSGQWTLKVSDRAHRDVGTVKRFSLELGL